MRLLVLGGTLFLGRHYVEAALKRGFEVTLFNRGRTAPGIFPNCEWIQGDRTIDSDLEKLQSRSWDAVIDTCGYVPRVVNKSAELLSAHVSSYVFVSSLSVYPDFKPHSDETNPLATLEDPTNENVQAHYGALKALCEAAVESHFPERALHLRAGLLIGPYDRMYRFPYWIDRLHEGGRVLAPGNPDDPVQLIDARDMAEWTFDALSQRTHGFFNITGPATPLSFDRFLDELKKGMNARFERVWAPHEVLLKKEIAPLDGFPLWVPPDLKGFFLRSVERAVKAGLTFRPLSETARDTFEWIQREGYQGPRTIGVQVKSGLPRSLEAEILSALA